MHTRCNQKKSEIVPVEKESTETLIMWTWTGDWINFCESGVIDIFVSMCRCTFMPWNRHSVSESASRSINRLQNEPKSVSQIIDFSWLFCFALTTKQAVFAGEEPKVPKHEVQNKEHALHCFLQHSVCALWIHPQCQTVNEVCSNVLREKIQPTQTLARRQLGGSWWHRTGSLATLTHPLPTLCLVLLLNK